MNQQPATSFNEKNFKTLLDEEEEEDDDIDDDNDNDKEEEVEVEPTTGDQFQQENFKTVLDGHTTNFSTTIPELPLMLRIFNFSCIVFSCCFGMQQIYIACFP